jgi:hypothetical protein
MQTGLNQERLQTFAAIAIEVQRISDDYQSRFSAAGTAEERQRIQQEATSEMTKAVEDNGMTVDQYNEVARVAQSDPEVARQITDYVRQES